jgi:hypothetical protein
MNRQQLTNQLRHQAARFESEPPAGLRRQVLSAIARVEPEQHARRSPLIFLAGSLATAACALALFFLLRDHPATPTIVKAPPTPPSASIAAVPATANPLALAHRWVDAPLEGEVQTLLTDLKTASQTVSNILPAPIKRPRPATSRQWEVGQNART